MLHISVKVLVVVMLSTICYGQIVERKGTEEVKPVKVQEILQIKYSHKELTEENKRWKETTTGAYTFILSVDHHGVFTSSYDKLYFVNDNKYAADINLEDLKKESYSLDTFKELSDYKKELRRGDVNINIDLFFRWASFYFEIDLNRLVGRDYRGQEVSLKYSKDHFITEYHKRLLPGQVLPMSMSRWSGMTDYEVFIGSRYIYGYLKLPKEIVFTPKVVKKILYKYKQAWECSEKKLSIVDSNASKNFKTLEEILGKKTLECLDRYLVWE